MRSGGLKPIVIDDLRGGRNATDPPMSLPFNQATEVINVDWKDATLGHKRGGATSLSLTCSSGGPFSTLVHSLIRHVPGADETAAELWAIDGTVQFLRLVAAVTWAEVTPADAVTGAAGGIVGVSFNGKLFFTYASAQDRLHCWDPALGTLRRVGLATAGAPSLADTGSGSLSVARYYRVRWIQVSGTTVVRRSDVGTSSTLFTSSGSGSAVRITRPSAPGEGETHWEVEFSTDAENWYGIFSFIRGTNIAIASTTADDNAAAASENLFAQIPLVATGNYRLFPSVKYLATDGNRLLGAGAWDSSGANSGGKSSRVWFTPVLGSSDQGDDERTVNTSTTKGWVDLNEKDGGAITALHVVNGVVYAWKYRQLWKLVPTGDATVPYLPRKLSDSVGCVAHKSVASGLDNFGRPAVYFMAREGPYRLTVDGLQYLGQGNLDIWRRLSSAAITELVAHSVYYADHDQWWLWVTVDAGTNATIKMMFDRRYGKSDGNGDVRGGWSQHTGNSANAICSVLFSNTVGAAMSRDLKPYVGYGGSTVVMKCDTSDTDDNGTDFQAYITTRPLLTTPDLQTKVGLSESTLIGKAAAGSDVSVTITRDFGKETRTHSVSLAPAGSETRVVKKVEGSEMGEADAIQLTIGDASANDEVWTVDAIVAPVLIQEDR